METEIVLYGVASMKLVHRGFVLPTFSPPKSLHRVQRYTGVGAGVGVGSWLAAILAQHSNYKLTSNKHYPHVSLC